MPIIFGLGTYVCCAQKLVIFIHWFIPVSTGWLQHGRDKHGAAIHRIQTARLLRPAAARATCQVMTSYKMTVFPKLYSTLVGNRNKYQYLFIEKKSIVYQCTTPPVNIIYRPKPENAKNLWPKEQESTTHTFKANNGKKKYLHYPVF